MSLDLTDMLSDWGGEQGDAGARIVTDRDGREFVQLRVDLGVLQMHTDGRPDGTRYHGLPSVLEYIHHELKAGRDAIGGEHWQALDRELTQLNHRRLAFASVVEEALRRHAEEDARRHLLRVLRDIRHCQGGLQLIEQRRPLTLQEHGMWPTLLFNEARLSAQLHILDHDHDAAIEAAERGAQRLGDSLSAIYGDPEDEPDEDIGVAYLRDLARQLRRQHGISQTLRERLEAAIDNEDYETAAALHEELARRDQQRRAQSSTITPPSMN